MWLGTSKWLGHEERWSESVQMDHSQSDIHLLFTTSLTVTLMNLWLIMYRYGYDDVFDYEISMSVL